MMPPNQEAMMETQLTRAARTQLGRSLRRRYQAASGREKKQILKECKRRVDFRVNQPT